MTADRDSKFKANTPTYYERKRAAEKAWIEVVAWVIVGIGVLLVFVVAQA